MSVNGTPQNASQKVTRPYIGGQAVLEGVMMRAPTSFAVVVRRKDGTLLVRERAMLDVRPSWTKWPFVRGIASLVESLRLGNEALRFSSDLYVEDLEKEEAVAKRPQENAEKGTTRGSALSTLAGLVVRALLPVFAAVAVFVLATGDEGPPAQRGGKESKGGAGLPMLLLVIGFFIALPQMAGAGVNRVFHLGLAVQSPAFQVLTGAFKLSIVVGYMLVLRRAVIFRRMFQFHGAEHKTISTYEAGEELVLANARPKTTLHPRCGTTFLVMIALVSIVVFTAIGGLLPRIHTGSGILDNVVFFTEKLPFLPFIAAITFEIQRLFARYATTGPLRVLLWPGFVVQKITTIEPDDAQLEVALASLRATLFRETSSAPASDAEVIDVAFPSYEALAASVGLRAGRAPLDAAVTGGVAATV